ncbi:MAG: hypothetical protein EA398_00500 [Deltaproteobacteria bacterium]|nr:MAG: hypothetical protein EA398_00500 [Deltaproteobacteria bacterium]
MIHDTDSTVFLGNLTEVPFASLSGSHMEPLMEVSPPRKPNGTVALGSPAEVPSASLSGSH